MEGPVYFPPTYRLVEGRDVCVCARAEGCRGPNRFEGQTGDDKSWRLFVPVSCLQLFAIVTSPFPKKNQKDLETVLDLFVAVRFV